jgi:predicted nucleic acid-binding protein
LSDPIPRALYVEAADIYREGRRHGLTIRSSLDCLIAAIAIHHKVPVWHRDRDFGSISKFTRLQTVNPLQLSAR